MDGEAFQTPYGDGIITEIRQDSLHIVTFRVQLLEDGSYRTCYVHQLFPIAKLTGIHDDCIMEDIVINEPQQRQDISLDVPSDIFDSEMVFEDEPEVVDRLPDIPHPPFNLGTRDLLHLKVV